MKKVLFLTILPFLLLGTARVSAQVRIGGSSTPHNAAVLDLNAGNEPTPTGNQGGLALPRVELTANDMELNGAAPVNGMLVYNTGGTLATGVYVWMTDKWVKASTGSVAYTGSTSIALDDGSFQREELTGDVTADKNSNVTTISSNAVTSDKIANEGVTADDLAPGAVTAPKLAQMGAASGQVLKWNGSAWAPAVDYNDNTTYTNSTTNTISGTEIQRAKLTGDVTADANSNVTTIGDGKVTSAKILDKTITADDICDEAIQQSVIAERAIVNSKLADASIDSRTLGAMGATAGQLLVYDGASWAPTSPPGSLGTPGGGQLVLRSRAAGTAFNLLDANIYIPYACAPTENASGYFEPAIGGWSNAIALRADGTAICLPNAACTCLFQTY
jgi:hypothetical protein